MSDKAGNNKTTDDVIEEYVDGGLNVSNIKKQKKIKNLKEYNYEYRKNHPEIWYKDNNCVICGGNYKSCGKSNHIRTMKHKYALLKQEYDNLVSNNK